MKVVFGILGAQFALVLCSCTPPLGPRARPELFCVLTSSSHGRTRCSFLRRAGADGSLLLYRTVWTHRGRVEECSVSSDQGLVRDYASLCGGSGHDLNTASLRFDVRAVLEPGGPCRFGDPMAPRGDPGSGVKKRQRRAWTFPGTLWCGHGSSADEYGQLGMFERVDSCCREHDHCQDTIRPFTVNFGVFNPTLFTISHCDCDHRLKRCLLDINDTISNMVGYSFFNVFKLRCFDLVQKKRCTRINWIGTCTSSKVAPLAVIRNQAAYNATSLDTRTPNPPAHLTKLSDSTKPKNEKKQSDFQTGPGHPKNVSPVGPGKTGGKTKTTSKTKGTKSEQKVPPVMKSPHTEQSSESKPQKHTAATKDQLAGGYKRVMPKHKCASRGSSKRPVRKGSKNKTFTMCETTDTKKHQALPSSSRKRHHPSARASSMTVTIATGVRESRRPGPGKSRTSPRIPNTAKRLQAPRRKKKKKKTSSSANENASLKEKPKPDAASRPRTGPRNHNDATSSVKAKTSPQKSTKPVGYASVCEVTRHLDDCGYRIRPSESAYGRHNAGSTTIYHCDCIQRLTEHIRKGKDFRILRPVLKSVSTSCIQDIEPEGCRKPSEGCPAILSRAKTLTSLLMRGKEYRDAGKAAPGRLYSRCLRALRTSEKVRTNPPKRS